MIDHQFTIFKIFHNFNNKNSYHGRQEKEVGTRQLAKNQCYF